MNVAPRIAPGASAEQGHDAPTELLTVKFHDIPEPASAAPVAARSWVVIAGQDDTLAIRFREALGAGSDVETLDLDADPGVLESRLEPGGHRHPAGRIVFFAPPGSTSESLRFEERWAWAARLVRIAQVVAAHTGFDLCIVTRTGRNGSTVSAADCPEHQFALGAARALAAEVPRALGAVVDVAPGLADAGRLARLLQAEPAEDELSLSETGVQVPRLTVKAANPQPLRLDPEARYLITGGLAGLTLELARWLPERGARHLTVLGRSLLDPARSEALTELGKLYASVDYRQADVGEAASISDLTDCLEAGPRRLGGVFHLASSWQRDGKSAVLPLSLLTPEDVLEVLRAKGEGGRLMDRLADRLTADFIVYFSTAAATVGSPAQINYAGANAVMDGLAERAVRSGRRALSLALGPVAQVGFGGSGGGSELHRLWEKMGIERLALPDVFEALEAAMSLGRGSAAAIRLGDQARANLPWLGRRPIYRDLFPDGAAAPTSKSSTAPGTQPADLSREQIEQQLLAGLSAILCLEPATLAVDQPLADAGVDSLVALELLFTVERNFGVSIPFNEAMLDPSVTLRTVAAEVEALLHAREAAHG